MGTKNRRHPNTGGFLDLKTGSLSAKPSQVVRPALWTQNSFLGFHVMPHSNKNLRHPSFSCVSKKRTLMVISSAARNPIHSLFPFFNGFHVLNLIILIVGNHVSRTLLSCGSHFQRSSDNFPQSKRKYV